jgi:hypothetical protein
MFVLILHTNFVLKNICYSCYILMKLELSQEILEKYSNIKFHGNPFSGSRHVSWGQTNGETDRHDEVKSYFPQFCERA